MRKTLHAWWKLRVAKSIWSALVAQPEVKVWLMMRDTQLLDPRSVTGSWMITGCTCGPWGACAWGYGRSRDLDRCCCLPVCDGWSPLPSRIGIWIIWGSGNGDRGRDRTRDWSTALVLSPWAGGGAGGNLVQMKGYLGDLADLVIQDSDHEVDQKVHEALDDKEHQDHQAR